MAHMLSGPRQPKRSQKYGKGSYATAEAAETAGIAIKKGHPVVRVSVYDSLKTTNKIIELPEDTPDPKPFKVYRVTWTGKQIECVAEYATEEEAFDHERRPNWHYAFYQGDKKIV